MNPSKAVIIHKLDISVGQNGVAMGMGGTDRQIDEWSDNVKISHPKHVLHKDSI